MKTSSVAAIATAIALCAGGSAVFANTAGSSTVADAGRAQLVRDRGADADKDCGVGCQRPEALQPARMPPAEAVVARTVSAATEKPADKSGLMPEGRSEPGTLALVVAGLALMGFVAGRRQSRDLA